MLVAIDVVCPTATHEPNEKKGMVISGMTRLTSCQCIQKNYYIYWPLVSFTFTCFVHKTIKIRKLPIPKYQLRPIQTAQTITNTQVGLRILWKITVMLTLPHHTPTDKHRVKTNPNQSQQG